MNTPESRPSVRFLEVGPEYQGQRIDNFLRRTLKGVPKSLLYRIMRKGEVRVNRARIKPDYRLQLGDSIRIPPLRLSPEKSAQAPHGLQQVLQQAILWEDKDVLVLNKPSGLAVHKGSGLEFGVIEILRALRPQDSFLELAHRLDRETSGCLLLAKNAQALRLIHTVLRTENTRKSYLALVRGQWNHGEREVSAPLRKNVLRGGERLVEVREDGKPAHSYFKPITFLPGTTLLEVRIMTGRTHQIRVHAASMGHPVAADSKYGDPDFNKLMIEYGLRRLFLHAHDLSLSLGDRELAVSAPLDESLKAVLECLEST